MRYVPNLKLKEDEPTWKPPSTGAVMYFRLKFKEANQITKLFIQ